MPFYDLGPSHAPIRASLLEDIATLVDSGRFTGGPHVERFEREFATYCGSAQCVGTSNGLDALRLILIAAGIERGDEVIVPANTFVATVEAVAQAGGKPVLVDASDTDYCLDAEATAEAVGPTTRFVVPVHLYGQMADMETISSVAARTGVRIVEDACQAHGAVRDGLRAGTVGLASAFSFYPAKNLGAFGDAGAVVTDDHELASMMRALREHGQREKYRHEFEGYTARLDALQALVLLHKLPLLEEWNRQRREAVRWYADALREVGDLRLPPVSAGSEPVWHLFVVRTASPAALGEHLEARGIQTGRHYPEPVHLSAAYSWLGYGRGAFPVTEALASEAISLPLFPGITSEQVEHVVDAIEDYFRVGDRG